MTWSLLMPAVDLGMWLLKENCRRVCLQTQAWTNSPPGPSLLTLPHASFYTGRYTTNDTDTPVTVTRPSGSENMTWSLLMPDVLLLPLLLLLTPSSAAAATVGFVASGRMPLQLASTSSWRTCNERVCNTDMNCHDAGDWDTLPQITALSSAAAAGSAARGRMPLQLDSTSSWQTCKMKGTETCGLYVTHQFDSEASRPI